MEKTIIIEALGWVESLGFVYSQVSTFLWDRTNDIKGLQSLLDYSEQGAGRRSLENLKSQLKKKKRWQLSIVRGGFAEGEAPQTGPLLPPAQESPRIILKPTTAQPAHHQLRAFYRAASKGISLANEGSETIWRHLQDWTSDYMTPLGAHLPSFNKYLLTVCYMPSAGDMVLAETDTVPMRPCDADKLVGRAEKKKHK